MEKIMDRIWIGLGVKLEWEIFGHERNYKYGDWWIVGGEARVPRRYSYKRGDYKYNRITGNDYG